MKNEITELNWKEHSCYSTRGEAKQKSIRLEMFTGRPTKIEYVNRSYWIYIGFKSGIKRINQTLEEFNGKNTTT